METRRSRSFTRRSARSAASRAAQTGVSPGIVGTIVSCDAIGASSSPGYLLRLKSGRLLLLWNRLLPEGRTDYPRRSGLGYSARPASWHRDELSLTFSSDDGRTWSEPKVILRGNTLVSYPSALERSDGEIWISVNHKGRRSFRFRETELAGASVEQH